MEAKRNSEPHMVSYNPQSFNLGMFKSLISTISNMPRKEYTILASPLMMAYMSNDKEKIAHYERLERVYKIGRLRWLISKFGYKRAKTMAVLNEKHTSISDDRLWRIREWGMTYRGFGKGELENVSLYVEMNELGLFSIRLRGDTDYGPTEYNVILNKGISYKSVLNQVSYFSKKLKQGIY